VENFYSFLRSQVEGSERPNNMIDEEKWEDLPSSVVHLDDETFQPHLENIKHTLVVFHVRCELISFSFTVSALAS